MKISQNCVVTDRSRAGGWSVVALAAAVSLSPAAVANDGDGVFTYTATDTGIAALRNANATPTESEIERIFAEWRETDHVFTWETTFSATANGKLPTGYVLVVNDGPMPKGWVGQLPAIYFDAETDFDNPIVNVFTYNGEDSATSYRFGTPDGDPAEPILSSHPDSATAGFVNRATATDNADGSRTFELEIDADPILAFTSQYSASNEALELELRREDRHLVPPVFQDRPGLQRRWLPLRSTRQPRLEHRPGQLRLVRLREPAHRRRRARARPRHPPRRRTGAHLPPPRRLSACFTTSIAGG